MNVDRQIRKFEKQAKMYDSRRSKQDLGNLRKRLLVEAHGRVLEIGVGAGANLPYYQPDVELTAVDFSPAMIGKAKAANDRQYGLQASFIVGDVEELSLPDRTFDTVVSTLTLCAYRNPAQVLNQLSRWCKPEGRVLLIEHGLSKFKAISIALKLADPIACRISGCHFNRDIMKLVQDAPLQIDKSERYMAGMLYVLWCRPQV